MKRLAIKGHDIRCQDVIKTFEMLGGRNVNHLYGNEGMFFFLNGQGEILYIKYLYGDESEYFNILSLEEFEKLYPYKPGDTIIIDDKPIPYDIESMHINRDNGEINYLVKNTSNPSLRFLSTVEGMSKSPLMKEGLTIKGEDVVSSKIEINIPEDYKISEIKDEKIILTKKIIFPKTFEECCKILGCKANHFYTDFSCDGLDVEISEYEDKVDDLLKIFRKLIYCRDAYWKIAGEQMGLGKPWEPKHEYDEEIFFIYCDRVNGVNKGQGFPTDNFCLVFPTEEMRNIFYDNFRELIEKCKQYI